MIKGILFDKDGTLLEFLSLWHGIIGEVLKELNLRYSVSKETIEKIKRLSGYNQNNFGKESRIQYLATTQIADLWMEILGEESERLTYKELLNLFNEKAEADNLEITALKGVKELLEYLKNKKYLLGVATADMEQSTRTGLDKAGILHYFDFLGFNEESKNPKPAPDMAVHFCRQMNLAPEELLIVGDSITDMEFAYNAGAYFIGIKTEYNEYEKFIGHGMQVVENIYDIVLALNL